jgi:hypothetical protein
VDKVPGEGCWREGNRSRVNSLTWREENVVCCSPAPHLAFTECIHKDQIIGETKKTCSPSKEMILRVEKTAYTWEKSFASYSSDKGFRSRIYKELQKVNTKRINSPINKQATVEQFSKEEIQMANKHTKKCSPSLAMKEMQIEMTPRFCFSLFRRHIFKKTNNNKCGGQGTLKHCWQECKLVQPLWKFLKTLKIELPMILISHSWAHTQRNMTVPNRHLHIPTYEAQFIIVKLQNKPRCPITNEWVKKLWYAQRSIIQP